MNKITNFRALLFIVVTPLISCATNLQPIAREPAKIEIEPGDEKTLATLDSALVRLEDAKLDFPSLYPRAGGRKAGNESRRTPPLPTIANESEQTFEKRATQGSKIKLADRPMVLPGNSGIDPQTVNTLEEVKLYREFLDKFPDYQRRDQVLYQIARIYDELGDVEGSMKIINQLISEHPNSRYIDEFQFRMGEYYLTRNRYLDAEEAYRAVVAMGTQSSYYEFALYKLGWALYKQYFYQEALRQFFALLDYKNSIGYDFNRLRDSLEDQRVKDILRVISLAFSNLGGLNTVQEYFATYGKPAYESHIYSDLGEYYLEKRRYSDAALSYKAFVKLNPYHKMSPHFDVRVNEIFKLGGFSQPVIEASRSIFTSYGLKSEYWKHNSIHTNSSVLGYVKDSLKNLANHFHARYQDKKLEKYKEENFLEAVKWYREFLDSFPKEGESPVINYQLADLLFEHQWYGQAATEYAHIAYNYPAYHKAEAAGVAAVYTLRKSLTSAPEQERRQIQRNIIDYSWKFADTFPQSENAAAIMEGAIQDSYQMKEYDFTVAFARKLLSGFPNADPPLRISTLIIMGHALFDLGQYEIAQESYQDALQLMPDNDPADPNVTEFLAASIYKQGEQANAQADYQAAAEKFFLVGQLAPGSTIRPAADYDGASALMQLKQWEWAEQILRPFPSNYPGHPLQPEARKNLALVYKETGRPLLAAVEYEQVETEVLDIGMRREALQAAAELYAQANDTDKAIQIYQRYIDYFPKPLHIMMEKRAEIAALLKARHDIAGYHNELGQIVAADAGAGKERSDRTRYLAAKAGLGLAEALFQQFNEIKLTQPFDQTLLSKSAAMKTARQAFENLLSYEVGEVTSAVTYYLAEMLYKFSQSLLASERPADLGPLEKEQYELSIEDQAYPFEEKAIEIHEKNLELITLGVYSTWIDLSIAKLAKLVPARYDKFERSTGYIETIDTFDYARLIDRKGVPIQPVSIPAASQ